jgi:HD-GYP domain-containing protein (c-di-GMP phosphodiesterase class II)
MTWLLEKTRSKQRALHGAAVGDGRMGDTAVSMPVILSALSFALDLTEGAVPGHALRTSLIGMYIGAELKLTTDQQSCLYYALLLKDIGCSSNAARMCQILGGGDDRAVKAGVKLEDWTRPARPTRAALQLLWRNVAPSAGAFNRAACIFSLGLHQHRNNAELIGLRCDRGAAILRGLGLDPATAEAVRSLDEHWDGSGYPAGRRGDAIPVLSRIACAAQHLDAFAAVLGPEVAIASLRDRSGRWFDPEIVRVAEALHTDGRLWSGCWSPGHHTTLSTVRDLAPGHNSRLEAPAIDTICAVFAQIVDAKSPFTYRHSVGVTRIATSMAQTMGMTTDHTQFIVRAALLHDLGKLRVPNSILDKNGKPSSAEWSIIQEHPFLTRQILSHVPAFGDLAIIAGAHHEKLDGSGYPDHLPKCEIPFDARLLTTADMYGALTEDRPYRAGLSREAALAILAKDVPHKLDPACYAALTAATQSMQVSN